MHHTSVVYKDTWLDSEGQYAVKTRMGFNGSHVIPISYILYFIYLDQNLNLT